MDKKIRKESSIPVQGRISIVDLANMDRYWAVKEGISIKSMSQLLSWTFTAMCDVIEANGKMPETFKRVDEANRYLNARGLYQKGMKEKGQSRIIAAMGFESLRDQGYDPARESKTAYDTIHGKQTIGLYDGKVDTGQQEMVPQVNVDEMVSKIREDKKKAEDYRQKELNDAINSSVVVEENKETMVAVPDKPKDRLKINRTTSSSDETSIREGMSDEELLKDREEKDKRRMELENAPINDRDFELVK